MNGILSLTLVVKSKYMILCYSRKYKGLVRINILKSDYTKKISGYQDKPCLRNRDQLYCLLVVLAIRIISYPTRAHGIIVKYLLFHAVKALCLTNFNICL